MKNAEKPDGLNSRILLAEDNETDRVLQRAILVSLGYKNIDEAIDGAMARHKLVTSVDIEKPYHIVITDWKMPGLSGIHLLLWIREQFSQKNLAVILLTGVADEEAVGRAVKARATDYIVKPVEKNILAEKLSKILGSSCV